MAHVSNLIVAAALRVRIAMSDVGTGIGSRIDSLGHTANVGHMAARSVERENAVIIRGPYVYRGRKAPSNVGPAGAEQLPPIDRVDHLNPHAYDRSTCPPPRAVAPHRDPAKWVRDINPGGTKVPGRDNNCGDCARATELTWRGQATVAGTSTFPAHESESLQLMKYWTPGDFAHTTSSEIAMNLTRLGPGASAVVAIGWRGGGQHSFNVFNVDGRVVACDGQTGRVAAWPPTVQGFGFDGTDVKDWSAVFIDPRGRHLDKADLTG